MKAIKCCLLLLVFITGCQQKVLQSSDCDSANNDFEPGKSREITVVFEEDEEGQRKYIVTILGKHPNLHAWQELHRVEGYKKHKTETWTHPDVYKEHIRTVAEIQKGSEWECMELRKQDKRKAWFTIHGLEVYTSHGPPLN